MNTRHCVYLPDGRIAVIYLNPEVVDLANPAEVQKHLAMAWFAQTVTRGPNGVLLDPLTTFDPTVHKLPPGFMNAVVKVEEENLPPQSRRKDWELTASGIRLKAT
jgi:hypothetical protein